MSVSAGSREGTVSRGLQLCIFKRADYRNRDRGLSTESISARSKKQEAILELSLSVIQPVRVFTPSVIQSVRVFTPSVIPIIIHISLSLSGFSPQ